MIFEPIADHLKRRLREAGPGRFEVIALRTGVTLSFIRKFVYGARENPRVQTIQPLVDLFAAIDRGDIELEELDARAAAQSEEVAHA